MLTEDDKTRLNKLASQRALDKLTSRLESLEEGDERDAVQLMIRYHRGLLGVL